jgi:osmotically-inducible protein OsmY
MIVALAGALALALPAGAAQPKDAWITTKVKMALLTSDRVDGLDVNVDTAEGNVTLHGQVETPAMRTEAEQVAASIDGVHTVRNMIAVVPAAAETTVDASDDQIRSELENVLERDAALEKSEIRVKSVNDGIVVLSGRADTLSAHRRALEDARSVDGVESVASEINSPDELADREIWGDADSVEPTLADAAADTWITTKVKMSLLAADRVDGLDVNVDTHEGVVTLFGEVDSEAKRQAAESETKKISGVKGVQNELRVAPKS